MHKYMRAIGFSQLEDRKENQKVVTDVIMNAGERAYTTISKDGIIAEFGKEFAPGLGIAVCGQFDEEDHYSYDYYYPYLRGEAISSVEDVTIERHAEKESYAGVLDDSKLGISLIFYLQNMISYIRIKNQGLLPVSGTTLSLSGLSIKGTILFPIMKNESEMKKTKQISADRARWINAAKTGDEEAIENLTMNDMDTYASISYMIQKQRTDILSIVDTYIMPYGVECDHYSIMGEIQSFIKVSNEVTGENIWKMSLLCNDMQISICINEMDLYGEPEIGRRFKGVIWLQGYINYPFQ